MASITNLTEKEYRIAMSAVLQERARVAREEQIKQIHEKIEQLLDLLDNDAAKELVEKIYAEFED